MDDKDTDLYSSDIPLAETIQTLRRQLQLAQVQSAGEEILFEMEKVELVLKLVISRTTKGQGGVQFYVVKAGGEVEKSGETTHIFKLTLTPVSSRSGERVKVSSQTKVAPSRK